MGDGPVQQEDFFRDLCESSYDLIQSVAPDGRLLYVNRAWLATLEYTIDEVQDLSLLDVIHPDSREHCGEILQQVLAGEPAREIEASLVSKSGRRILVEGSASCRFEGGRPVATRAIFRDVTDKRDTEERLDRLFQLSQDLLCIAGTDGYFKRINPAFERVLGYERGELLRSSFLDFVHPDDRESTVREVENLAQGKMVVDFQNRYRARDGSWRWLAWRSTPAPDRGLIYAVARDITEQKRAQELLERQANELARSNADLEQFAYAASHDLQAPLRAVTNLADWIDKDLERGRKAKVAEYLDKLQERARRMQTLIDDLLAYSRAGRRPTEVGDVDTAELVRHAVEHLDPPRGFSVETDASLPEMKTAAAPLGQVFRNLIANAVRHHDRPSGRIKVTAVDRGAFWEFAVADDGPGIPPESVEEIFEMFHRLRSHAEVAGSGIGLALVRRLVEGAGGRVWVDPPGARGATFRFTWPKTIETEIP